MPPSGAGFLFEHQQALAFHVDQRFPQCPQQVTIGCSPLVSVAMRASVEGKPIWGLYTHASGSAAPDMAQNNGFCATCASIQPQGALLALCAVSEGLGLAFGCLAPLIYRPAR